MKRGLVAVMAGLLLAGAAGSAPAQGRLISLDGRVQWVAGQIAVLHLDNGGVIHVDLTRVPTDEYLALKTRDRVKVVGTISEDGNRVAATSVTRSELRTEEAPARRMP